MRISDWSSDVCSSDLFCVGWRVLRQPDAAAQSRTAVVVEHHWYHFGFFRVEAAVRAGDIRITVRIARALQRPGGAHRYKRDRKGGVQGKRVSVRGDLGGHSICKKNNYTIIGCRAY